MHGETPADRRPAVPTRHAVAGWMAVGWSAAVVLFGLVVFVALPEGFRASERGYCENDDHPGPCASLPQLLPLLVPGLAVIGFGAWSLRTSGRLARRGDGRRAVVATFGVCAALAAGGLLLALTAPSGPDPAAVAVTLAGTAYSTAVVVLAAGAPSGGHRGPAARADA